MVTVKGKAFLLFSSKHGAANTENALHLSNTRKAIVKGLK